MLAQVNTQALRRDFSLLVATVGRDVELQEQANGRYAGPCPFCGTGRDRFMLFPDTGYYWCRQCHKRGDVLQYIQDKHQLDFVAAAKWLGQAHTADSLPALPAPAHQIDGAEWDAWREHLEPLVIRAAECLHDGETAAPARAWLEKRGVTRDTWGYCLLGYNDRWRTVMDGVKLPPGILLPRFHPADGVVTAVNCYLTKDAAATTGNRRMFVKGSRPKDAWFNELWLKDATTAILVEGELDAALLGRFLPSWAVALASGGCDTIPDMTALAGKYAVILLDNDEGGQAAVHRWYEKLPASTVTQLAKVPGDYKDITDAWRGGYALGSWAKELMAYE